MRNLILALVCLLDLLVVLLVSLFNFELTAFNQSLSLSQNLLSPFFLLSYFVPDLHFLPFFFFNLLKQLVELQLKVLIFGIANIHNFLFLSDLFSKRFVFLFFNQLGEAFSLLYHISSLPKIFGIRIYFDI